MNNGAPGGGNTTARTGGSRAFQNTGNDPFGGGTNADFSNGYASDNDVAGVESDDPTNTAMCLDENDEKELYGVTPGTPMAFKKLGQLTAKSITRQKDAQTPARTRVGLAGSSGQQTHTGSAKATRYVNTGSPSKKGKQEDGIDLLSSAIPRLTPKNNGRQGISKGQAPGNDEDVPMSIRHIRASRRAGEMLSRIKMGSLESKIPSKAPLSTVLAEKNKASNSSALAQNQALPRTTLDPEFDKNEFSPFMLPKPRILFPTKGKENGTEAGTLSGMHNMDERCTTPENKRPLTAGNGTPYNILRALSEKSDRSQKAMRPDDSDKKDISSIPFPSSDPFVATPKQRKRPLAAVSTPMSEHRVRIQTLRKYFNETNDGLQPGEPSRNADPVTPMRGKKYNGTLIDFTSHSEQLDDDMQLSPSAQMSQVGSIKRSGGSPNILASPSPMRRNIVANTNGTNRNISSSMDGSNDSVSSLLISLAGEHQNQDPTKPIPFVLNQGLSMKQQEQEQGQEQEQDQNQDLKQDVSSSSKNNFMDISMQLNSSIAALNCGLREQLERGEGTSESTQNGIDTTANAMENVTAQLSQSLVSLIPDTCVGRTSAEKHTASESELEVQVETLRKTMEDTKSIVFAIQRELSKKEQQEQEQKQQQGGSLEDSKLDSILGLLGALDMRLHMLEGRQRLEQNASLTPQRSNIGSTKVYANSRQQSPVQDQNQGQNQNRQQDIISRIGQLAAYFLNRYPLMIIGALFIILLSELLVIGGFSLDTQSMRGLGRYALEEMKRHIPAPPQPPS
ncbi:hypothetical protein IW140_001137 [Coemansia sp. RSA 1813]|nr:hypothetical protein EV178_002362 [Coemansia sp. RSA 1646]KAJ1773167.1 hypothetical protein LPJ74_000906 [Coemansia sp. RSA 1843]KAJ2092044.1 hypothetical protein IW138_001410 [Coemansia sp. RSA 986]KAJ2216619.1 hypothetical protein EV179_001158 [Coemansia sp. RSA 487]KAJ2572097.1 hypothetical protein IW140_001137 [Coemansia sp. RSA 1813]